MIAFRWLKISFSSCRFSDLPESYLRFKEDVCLEILKLMEMLDVGQCKIRGLLLYELLLCKREKCRRGLEEQNNKVGSYKKYGDTHAYL